MASYCTTVRVRYADTDAGGVVYHANYIVWLEAGRTECLRGHGVPYTDLQAEGIHLPVIDLQLRYHRPAFYDQLIEVWTWVEEISRIKVRFGYQLRIPGEGKPLATAHTTHSFVNSEGRVIRMDRHPELWRRVLAAVAQLSPASA